MLLQTLGASLLPGKSTISEGEGTIRAGKGTIRASQDFYATSFFNKVWNIKTKLNLMVFIKKIIYLKSRMGNM